MNKYRGSSLVKPGFIGVVLIVLGIAVGLSGTSSWRSGPPPCDIRHCSLRWAGWLRATTSRCRVSRSALSEDVAAQRQAMVTFTIKGTVRLGSDTTAHIRTGSLLGQRMLTLESAGSGRLHPMDVIPVSRTSSPYSITDAVSDLTTDIAGTDTDTLNQSLDTLSATIDQIAPQLGPTFDGVTRLSQALNGRNKTLGELFKDAADVTGILSERSDQVNTLILNANDLLDVLVDGGKPSCSCWATPRRWPSSCPEWCTTTKPSWRRRWKTQLSDRDAGKEPRQHRQIAARFGQVRTHHGGDCASVAPTTTRWSPTGFLPELAATVPGLLLRVPQGRKRRPTARQCGATGRVPLPGQRDSTRPGDRWAGPNDAAAPDSRLPPPSYWRFDQRRSGFHRA